MYFSSFRPSSISSRERLALCSKRAIDIGKAKVNEQIQRVNSIAFAAARFFGQSLIFYRIAFPMAGKNRTGRGRMTLEKAVSLMAFLPAAILLPYSTEPS